MSTPTMSSQSTATTSSLMTNDSIPSGAWTLWYHSPHETRWTLATYKAITTVSTWTELWTLIDSLSDDTLLNGFFRFMKHPITPMWENPANIRGGAYSMRIPRKDAADVFMKYSIGVMLGSVAKDSTNELLGVAISPKRGFNVISVWNNNYEVHAANDDIKYISRAIPADEIRYTKHTDRQF
jgi:hypothetical protein